MKTLSILFIPFIMYLEHRAVYLFYNRAGSNLKDKQVAELYKDEKGVQERDITVHLIELSTGRPEIKKWHINTSDSFTFLLVGKDGGEKLRSQKVITNEKLFAVIDAMPMRKTEMKKE